MAFASSPLPRRSRRISTDPIAEQSPEEVLRHFTSTPRYESFLKETHDPVHRVGLFFHAAYLEAFHRAPPYRQIPDYLARHIAQILEDKVPIPLPYPETIRTFDYHAARVRAALGWLKFSPRIKRTFEKHLAEEAERSDDPHFLRDSLEAALESAKVVFPAPYLLERMVGHARRQALEKLARRVSQELSGIQIQAIDGLRKPRAGGGRSTLQWLKDPLGVPSPRAIHDVLDRIEFIRSLDLPAPLFEKIDADMRRRMMKNVEAYTVDSLWDDFPDLRRRSLVAVYLFERLRALIDFAVEIFDSIALAMERRSEADLAADLRAHGPAINEKLLMFKTMAEIVVDYGIPDPAVRPAILEKIPRDHLLAALRELEELIRPADFNIFDYLESRYSYLRSFFPRFLKVLQFEGIPAANSLLAGVAILKYWNAEGVRKPPTEAPLDFVPHKWRPYVIPGDGKINRHYYELCVMSELHRMLQSTEVWVVGGRRYGNVEDLLIPPARWAQIRDECYQELGLPKDPKEWLSKTLPALEAQIKKTVERLPQNRYAIVDEDRVRLHPFEAEILPEGVQLVKERIKANWQQVRIQDLLAQVSSWVDMSDCFKTLRGYHKGGLAFERGLYAALIAKGCNIGTSRMASLAPEVPERSLRTIDENYLSEDTLKTAFDRLLKAQRDLPISKWLGEEWVSMSDGMRLATRVGTVRAALLPHAFAPGVRSITYYWHVSHQGPAYSAQVIGHDRDAAYVLDQIFHIQSELPIHEHYTDTHGATEITFALSYLNRVEFCPRIKLVHLQDLYTPPGFKVEGPFRKHFEREIDWDLIETHWDDVVRILASLRRRNVSAVTLCLRLSSYARQNALYRAVREVGRIFKTQFIMRYYDEVDFRRRINSGLNRMEFFNALARHLFYARRGENWERDMDQQLHRASALLVLANSCVLWNSVRLTEVVQELRTANIHFSPEDFRHVSPYAFEHIIPYGQYFFNLRKKGEDDSFSKARGLK
jgi:TnpA family transposase